MPDLRTRCVSVRSRVLCFQTYNYEGEAAYGVCMQSTVREYLCGELVVVNPILFGRYTVVAFVVDNIIGS